jgi:hypothetical protein
MISTPWFECILITLKFLSLGIVDVRVGSREIRCLLSSTFLACHLVNMYMNVKIRWTEEFSTFAGSFT